MKPRQEFVRKEDRQASALLQTAAEGSRTATALEQQPAQEADGVCHGLLHLGHRVPVREGDEGVRQRAVDVHVACDAHAPDARVEVDGVVEQRVEAAHLQAGLGQLLQRLVGREDRVVARDSLGFSVPGIYLFRS